MANRTLFSSYRGSRIPAANAINEAGGTAYSLSRENHLAQFAATGCLNGTFYASAGMQLEKVLTLCSDLDPKFIAQVALYSRKSREAWVRR